MAQAIQRPVAPTLDCPVPPTPSIPPTDGDIAKAHEYVMAVGAARRDGMISGEDNDFAIEDYGEAIRYEARLLAYKDGRAPWFDAAIAPLIDAQRENLAEFRRELTTELTTVKNELTTVKNELTTVKNELTTVKNGIQTLTTRHADFVRVYSKKTNYEAPPTPHAPLQIVPFPDGVYPSDLGLPQLNTVTDVNNLTAAEQNTYLEHYYPNEVIRGTTAERKKLLFRALGYVRGVQP